MQVAVITVPIVFSSPLGILFILNFGCEVGEQEGIHMPALI